MYLFLMLLGNDWCFIHVPRTGGMCTRRYLLNKIHCSQYKDIHSKADDIDVNIKFCFGYVRNPYEREFSLYTLADRSISFDEWIASKFAGNNNYNFLNTVELQRSYFNNDCTVYRYENRDDALYDISKNLELDYNDFKSYKLYRNSYRNGKDYRSAYTNTSYDIVTHSLQEDLITYNYSFDK